MSETCWLGNRREVAKVLYHSGSEDPEVRANARLIVRAVNGHQALVDALKQTLDALYNETSGQDDSHWITQVKTQAHEALRQAEEAAAKARKLFQVS